MTAALLIGMAGCAKLPDQSACTSIISNAGGIVRFCADGDKVQVAESGARNRGDARMIVNDPVALASLARHVKLLAKYKVSRRVVAQSCSVGGDRYVRVKADDLDRILRDTRAVRPEGSTF